MEVFDGLVFYSSIIVPLQDILAYLDKRKVQGAGLYHCIGWPENGGISMISMVMMIQSSWKHADSANQIISKQPPHPLNFDIVMI